MALGRTLHADEGQQVLAWAIASFVFGGLVGLSEILSRYRDEPLLAATTVYGFTYLALNGLISLAAFVVLRGYPEAIFPNLADDLFLSAVAAGFGGMVVFRSKLFTYRASDGKEYSIGPALVLDTILRTVDQKIDRRRATQRQQRIMIDMAGVKDFDNAARYLEASLNSFQNLSKDEKAEITAVIDQYRSLTTWSEQLKIMALGFAFLNIAGEENFNEVITRNLKPYLTSLPQGGGTGSGTGGTGSGTGGTASGTGGTGSGTGGTGSGTGAA